MADSLEYEASDAKAKFAELLDQVEHSRTGRVTRRGRTIARIVPEAEALHAEAVEALKRLKGLREQIGKAPREEILASRRQGLNGRLISRRT